MKTNIATKTAPEIKKKLRLPDQIDLIEEDGTVYHVRSFFVAKKTMGEVLNELSLERIDRVK